MEKCISCGDEVTNFVYNRNGQPVCETCEESALQYSDTVIVITDEIKRYSYTSEFGFRDDNMTDVENPLGISGFEYKKTDAWRGYDDPIIAEGYSSVLNGWATGGWSDVPWKHKFNDFFEALMNQSIQPPIPITIVLSITSNVFSTSVDIIIRESDREQFESWLSEIGYTMDALDRALT